MLTAVNGIQLHYRVCGPPGAPLLLFVHGFPHSSELWLPLVELLQSQYRLIIPDLRGFGQSELADRVEDRVVPPISIDNYADDLFGLLEEIGENRPAVTIGLSMGGYIVLEFYRRFTSNVRAMVLVDTRAEADTPAKKAERLATAQRVLDEGSQVVADAMSKTLFSPSAPPALVEQWRCIMASTRPEAMAAGLLAMAGRPDSRETLSRIYCPALVVVGQHDSITPVSDARRIHEAMLAAELVIVPDAGHMTPVEQPDRFGNALTRFLGDVVKL